MIKMEEAFRRAFEEKRGKESSISKEEIRFCEKLAREGKYMNDDNREEINNNIEKCEKLVNKSYLAYLISESLVWSKYAKEGNLYWYRSAMRYIINGNENVFKNIKIFIGPYGKEDLKDCLKSWKLLHDEFYENITKNTPIKILKKVQDNLLKKITIYSKDNKIKNIGPWFWTSIFKIVLTQRKGIIERPETDKIYMPLGRHVIKGVRLCIKQGFSFTEDYIKDFINRKLEDIEYNIEKDLPAYHGVHVMTNKMTGIAKSRVIHINSGLWLLGKVEIEI